LRQPNQLSGEFYGQAELNEATAGFRVIAVGTNLYSHFEAGH